MSLGVRSLAASARDIRRDSGSIPEFGRFPGGGNGNLLLYLCLENPMVSGVWQAVVHGVRRSQKQLKQFSTVK